MIPSQTNASTKERIRAQAKDLGFGAIGFAGATTAPHVERLHAWIAEGHHGTMRWMARGLERRADPRQVLRSARTVISVSIPYYHGDWPAREGGAPRGRIARYAWGRDYHKLIRRRLRRLARAIVTAVPETRWLAYADTGPMLDRAWAERSGVGWIGKNTNVIVKESGSYSFLGEILTNLEIDPDPPARNHCGTCARCITACPTGAIVGPYRLDARRCISYLTIENKGVIPLALREAIGTRIFGCDDCQEVCPWNRFAVPTQDPEFLDKPGQATPELIPLLALDEEGFRSRYQGTAILRARRSGFARNVAVALGNLGDPSAVKPLARALAEDPDALVRGHAAWALGRIADDASRATLRAAALRETSEFVLAEIHAALASCTKPQAISRTQGATP